MPFLLAFAVLIAFLGALFGLGICVDHDLGDGILLHLEDLDP